MADKAEACVVVTPVSPGQVVYDPTSDFPYKEKLKVAVRASSGCGQGPEARIGDFSIGFVAKTGQAMQFQILGNGNLLGTSAATAPMQSFDLSNTDTAILEFDLKIERGQPVMTSQLEFDIVYRTEDAACEGIACNSPVSLETLPIALPVEPIRIFSLSVAGAARGSVDFGDMATGQQRRVMLSLAATAPYRIFFDSQNDQNLVIGDGTSLRPEDRVPYNIALNGVGVSEAAPYSNAAPFGTGGISLDAQLDFTIADAEGKRAGKYRDVLTITIEPLMSAGIAAPAS
ncbi:MAG: hypothetical protein QM698_07040 [Micropepsaceae bacterium]